MIAGSASTAGPHQLAVTAGTVTASTSWQGSGDWTQTIPLDTESTTSTIALLPAALADQVLLGRVAWTRPVRLTVDAQGATSQGEAGIWRSHLGDLGDGQARYDMTDPAQLVAIGIAGGGFAAGPEAHQYLVTGATTLHTPEVQQHQPIDRVTSREAGARRDGEASGRRNP